MRILYVPGPLSTLTKINNASAPYNHSSSGYKKTMPSNTIAGLPAALQHHLANQLDRDATTRCQASATSLLMQSSGEKMVPFASLQSTSTRPPMMQANPVYNAHFLQLSEGNSSKPNSGMSNSSSMSRNIGQSAVGNSSSLNFSSGNSGSKPVESGALNFSNEGGSSKPMTATTNGTAASANKTNLAAQFAASSMLGEHNKKPSGHAQPKLSTNNNINNNNSIDAKGLLSEFSESFQQMSVNKSATEDTVAKSTPNSVAQKSWTSFD